MIPETPGPIRIYVSCVPEDMEGELSVLSGLILPELRRRARGLNVEVLLVDPSETKEGWDLARRFQEIDACRHLFIGLLGERYGNLLPASTSKLLETFPWLAEPVLSLLEAEIRYAVLDNPRELLGGFFYFREPGFSSRIPERQRQQFLPESSDAAEQMLRLKNSIRASGYPVLDGYPSAWSDGLGRATHLDLFAEKVLEDLWGAISSIARGEAVLRSPIGDRDPEILAVGDPQAGIQSAPPSRGVEDDEDDPTGVSALAAHLPPEKPLTVHENVQFTVYRPRVVAPAKWLPLLAFAHLEELPSDAPADQPDPAEEVRSQAQTLLGGLATSYADLKQDSRHAIPHEAEITFLPSIPGFEINPPRRTFLWLEAVHREEFRIRAGAGLDGQTVRGRMSVFWGNILLAEISLGIRVDSRSAGATVPTPVEPSAGRPFRNIFPSYSHKDTSIVEEFERYARTMGDRYLRDVYQLRAGEIWNPRLKELINEADVFQLFWSWNSLQSPYVEQEWRYALSLRRPYFVRPTYWEVPLPTVPDKGIPPSELSDLHFQLLNSGLGESSHPVLHESALPASPPSQEPSSKANAKTSYWRNGVVAGALAGILLATSLIWRSSSPQASSTSAPTASAVETAPPPTPSSRPEPPLAAGSAESGAKYYRCELNSLQDEELRQAAEGNAYLVELKSFSNPREAAKLSRQLEEDNLYLIPTKKLRKNLCVVALGPFSSKTEAQEAAKTFRIKGFNPKVSSAGKLAPKAKLR